MSDDWIIVYWENGIIEKQGMIRLISRLIAEKMVVKDQIQDGALKFEMEVDIQELHTALKKVAESVNLNRRMIRERREELRLRNSQFIGAKNQAGPEEGTSTKAAE